MPFSGRLEMSTLNLRAPTFRRLAARTVALGLLAASVPVAVPRGDAALSPVVTVLVDGRGYGHGEGLSQWGAYGWATLYGRTWQEIVGLYYGGTSISTVRDADFVGVPVGRMTVQLTALDGRQTAVVSDTAALTTPADPESRAWGSVVAREVPGRRNVYSVWGHAVPQCPAASDPLADTAGWVLVAAEVTGPVDITTPTGDTPGAAVPAEVAGLCDASGAVRYYRGVLRATNDANGADRTVNSVLLEDYVRGVVPRESSASWADAAGGAGINALRAQAVAARSYAMAGSPRTSFARTCDTTSCQVYGGAGVRTGGLGASFTRLEDPRSNRAVDDTAGVVMRTSAGKVANTMFAASNGGRSLGKLFPAIDDPADAVAANPNHTWSLTLTAGSIMSAFPSIGQLLDITVTKRSGGGTWGGWVETIVLTGSTKNLTITGDAFRQAFNLKSRYLNFTLVRAAGGPPVGPGLMIGDSVGASAVTDIGRMMTGAYRLTIDAKSQRCTIPRTGICATNNAMPIITASPAPAWLLMELGYNDVATKFGATIDTAMQAITARGVTRVIWVNFSERRLDANGKPAYGPANAALQAARARWPQLVVLDWNGASSGSEADGWFVKGTASNPDLVHLTSLGRTRFALFLRAALDELRMQGLLPAEAPPPDPGSQPARPVLKRGDTGLAVVELQIALTAAGYTLTADGQFGPTTESKVKAFQTAKQLTADGIVGPSTWAALGLGPDDSTSSSSTTTTTTASSTTTVTTTSSTTTTTTTVTTTSAPAIRPILKRGSSGPAVVELQQALRARGFTSVVADGQFGSRTQTAVRAFQKSKKLVVDGVVGPKTWKALGF